MIATEAQISGLDQTRKEYYDYLSEIYGEIATYLKIQDGAVNSQKLELMFEKTASPFVYWNESRTRNGISRCLPLCSSSPRCFRTLGI